MHKAKIIEIGEMVPAFEEENLVILFGTQITDELRPICVVHETLEYEENPLAVGKHISFGDKSYELTAVGDAANKNFEELGHISIYFRDGDNEPLPGAIIAKPSEFPPITLGDEIAIY